MAIETIETDAGGIPNSKLEGRQARLLLALLVLERERGVPREEIVELLWPSEPPQSWQPALRGVVSKVRAAFAAGGLPAFEILTSAGGYYQLRLPAGTAVDLERAMSDVEAADRALHGGRPAQAIEYATAAREVLARPFLVGEQSPWVDRTRAELRGRLLRALEILSEGLSRSGESALAIEIAEEAVGLEPLRESAHRQLMAAHAAAGNRAEALRSYEQCRVLLAEELGIRPSPETASRYLELLRSEDEGYVPATSVPAGLASVPEPLCGVAHFVGRNEALEWLEQLWRQVKSGRRELVLIRGEGGVGKTALAGRFAEHARADDAAVLYGRCDPQAPIAYAPFVEALRRFSADCPDEQLRNLVTGQVGTPLLRLTPELAQRLPHLACAPVDSPTPGRHILFSAAATFLRRLSTERPVVLVIDDLQWAGAGSLLLLRYLMRALESTPLLLLVLFRNEEVGRDSQVVEAIATLQRELDAHNLELQDLDAASTMDLIRLTGEGRDLTLEWLHDYTGGNPLFVVEYVREVLQALNSGTDNPKPRSFKSNGIGIPPAVCEAIRWRRSRLSHSANLVLNVASALGPQFDISLVQRVGRVDANQALDAVEEAVNAGIVREVAGQIGEYEFVREVVRDAIYDSLPSVRQAWLHSAVGEALEELPEPDYKRIVQLSHHFLEAGPRYRDKAVEYMLQAAFQSLDLRAYERAVSFFRTALNVGLEGRGQAVRRCQALIALGRAERQAGRELRARDAYLQAVQLAQEIGDPESLARGAVGLTSAPSTSRRVHEHVRVGLLQEALEALPADESELRLQVMTELVLPPGHAQSAAGHWLPQGVKSARERVPGIILDGIRGPSTLGTP